MECNKDEAIRSKQIAEGKFVQHDIAGAKKFALKARQLFPDLEGLPQLIAVLDVHLIAQDKLNGVESNWYGVLQVDPTADEATIRKHYRKLALLLHPDKNKAVGAEAAFKIVSEAWGVLSDKTKKAMHDMRRNANTPQSSKVTYTKDSSSSTSNVFNKFGRPAPSKPTTPQCPVPSQPQVPQPQDDATAKSSAFWTACPYCKMMYEYLRIYENQNLACVTCSKPFVAREVQVVGVSAWWPPPYQQGFGINSASARAESFATAKENLFSGQVAQEADDKVRREQVEAQRKARRKEQREKERQKKIEKKAKELEKAKETFANLMARAKLSSEQLAASQRKMTSGQAADLEDSSVKLTPTKSANLSKSQNDKDDEKGQGSKVGEGKDAVGGMSSEQVDGFGDVGSPRRSLRCKRNVPNTFTNDDERQMKYFPPKKTRPDVQIPQGSKQFSNIVDDGDNASNVTNIKIHAEWSTVGSNGMGPVAAGTEDGGSLKNKRFTAADSRDIGADKNLGNCSNEPGLASKLVKESTRQFKTCEPNSLKTELDCCQAHTATDADAMNVPDPDFYDFDKDRTESHFAVGQIWAIYDDDDGMPRYYARINKVFSLQPFKVQMSWLEPRLPSNLVISWLESGFASGCGEYKLGKVTTSEYINTFSHLVSFEKGQRGVIKIYPRKGDIWALYKEWNVAVGVDGRKHDYEMVEVLADYKEEVGVNIIFLVKMEGFKTLFQRAVGVQTLIPSQELLRFSHQVPAHQLMSEEALGVSEGCWELDPASTPLELIMGGSRK